MWILPNNLSESYPCVQEFVDSKEDLNERALQFSQSSTWKSKHSPAKTWLRRWKRVYWLRHLFIRTLKPSMQNLFVEKFTESLEVIPASHLVSMENGGGKTIQDTYGLSSSNTLQIVNHTGASSKTYQA